MLTYYDEKDQWQNGVSLDESDQRQEPIWNTHISPY